MFTKLELVGGPQDGEVFDGRYDKAVYVEEVDEDIIKRHYYNRTNRRTADWRIVFEYDRTDYTIKTGSNLPG